MNIDKPEAKAFLFELYTQTNGDINKQVSTDDVGASLDLEKAESGTMAEDLIIQGYAELKTLSGGIGITLKGLEVLNIKIVPESKTETLTLGTGTVIEDQGKKNLEKIIQDIKDSLSLIKLTYAQQEELVIDIKTIEIQMLSPCPKTKIIREGLRSLHKNFAAFGPDDLSKALNSLIIS
jgi:hypothetical protein